jgi:alpha-amylase
MSVALIGWGRFFDSNGNKITVPAPVDNTGKPWLWDFLASQAPALAQAGFDTIQLPPASKAWGGTAPGTDGYGCFDPRDLGDKNQMGSVETRYGSAESLRRLFAVAHASGLAVYLDLVLHQLDGANEGNGVYRYLGSDGKTLNGRGPMNSGCFRGIPPANRPEDDVPAPADDFAFGDEKVYQNCEPAGYTIRDALDAGDWIFRTLDADGSRFDDAKGIWAQFAHQFMTSDIMAGRPFYAEYFDGNPADLNWWATSPPMNGRSGVEDFTNHFAIQTACDSGDAEALNGAGYSTWRPDLSYVFVDNPDTDTTAGEQVVSAKLLGYAFLATIAAKMLLVYGKDYYDSSVWPGAYGLKPWIDNLVYINKKYAYGNTITQYVDEKVIVLNRDGQGGPIGTSPGLLTAINFDTYNQRTITCATTFGANVRLHDLTGRHGDIWTDSNGRATFTIPSNAWNSGQSYLCFTVAGHDSAIAVQPRQTNQTFFGSPDLSIGPATAAGSQVCRIWCAPDSTVSLNKILGNGVRFTLTDEDGAMILHKDVWSGKTRTRGWHTLTAFAPSAAEEPFTVEVSYTGTVGLTESEMMSQVALSAGI